MLKFHMILYVGLILVGIACGPLAVHASNQGNQAFAQSNYDAALRAYEHTESVAPGMSQTYYNAGNTYYQQREFVEAKAQFQQALLDADERLAQKSLFNLGNAYFNSFEFDRAIEAYKEALRLDPSDMDAKHNLELALQQLLKETSVGGQEQERTEQESQQQDDPENDDQQQAQEQENQQSPEQQSPEPPRPQQLTEEQARQLLESVAQDTETLRDHTRQIYVVPEETSGKDW